MTLGAPIAGCVAVGCACVTADAEVSAVACVGAGGCVASSGFFVPLACVSAKVPAIATPAENAATIGQ